MFGALTRSANRKSKNVHAESPLNTTHQKALKQLLKSNCKKIHQKALKQLLKSNCKKIVLPIDFGGHI